jgi:hypothetical protein
MMMLYPIVDTVCVKIKDKGNYELEVGRIKKNSDIIVHLNLLHVELKREQY